MPAFRTERRCPKCGSFLMIKEGEYGDFLACPKFPACRYTEPIRNEEQLRLLTKLEREDLSRYCERCHHTGLLPHPTIPHAWLDCECKQNLSREHYHPFEPEDFDFPCSDTFRGFVYEIANRNDPARTQPTRIIEKHTREIVRNVYEVRKPVRKPIQRGADGKVNNREDITYRLY